MRNMRKNNIRLLLVYQITCFFATYYVVLRGRRTLSFLVDVRGPVPLQTWQIFRFLIVVVFFKLIISFFQKKIRRKGTRVFYHRKTLVSFVKIWPRSKIFGDQDVAFCKILLVWWLQNWWFSSLFYKVEGENRSRQSFVALPYTCALWSHTSTQKNNDLHIVNFPFERFLRRSIRCAKIIQEKLK